MKVGVSGHQDRDGADWKWTVDEIDTYIRKLSQSDSAYSSLAAGADQIFAERAIDRGLIHTAVIPSSGYERTFEESVDRERFDRLLSRSKVVRLPADVADPKAFLAAGRWIVDQVDELLAIWDEKPAAGIGGTGEVVSYAMSLGLPVFVINPINQSQGYLRSTPDEHHG